MLVARREDRLHSLRSELEALHRIEVRTYPCDLSNETACEKLAMGLEAEGPISLLVNNAGFGTKGLFHRTDWARQVEMHRLHIMATMRLTRAVLPGMIAREWGGVINVASVAGFFRSAGSVGYCATKGWMNDFTEGLRLELDYLGKRNVMVQALCPGFTYTEFHDVMQLDRTAIPKPWWLAADFVVEESLKGLETRKLFVVPGWRYKLLVALGSRLPVGLRLMVERRSGRRRQAGGGE
jgi:short-subunit dehydrogenase